MKIKSKNKKPVKKLANSGNVGGGIGASETSNLSQKWGNINSNQGVGKTSQMSGGAKFGMAFGQNLAQGMPQLMDTYNNPQSTAADKTRATAQLAGDSAAGAIPGFGAFYGAARGITSTIQNAIPGEDMKDDKTGVTVNVKKTAAGRAFDQLLTPDHTHASNSWALAAASKSDGDKAKYGMLGVADLLGFTKVARMGQAAEGRSPEGLDLRKPHFKAPAQTALAQNTDEQIPGANLMALGGSLEQYNLPKHSQLPNNFANAKMDGQGVQLEKDETKLAFPNGGKKDYAFSPNLGFLPNGEPTTDESKVKVTFADASKKIENKKTFGYDKANANSLKYKFQELQGIAEATRQAKEGPDQPMQAANGGGVNKYEYSGGVKVPTYESQHVKPLLFPQGDPNNKNMQFDSNGKFNRYYVPPAPHNKFTDKYPVNNDLLINDSKTSNPKDSKSKMAAGDIMQLASTIGGGLANIGAYLGSKSDKVRAHTVDTTFPSNKIAEDYNPLNLAYNAARYDINNSSPNNAARIAALTEASSNMGNSAQKYSLDVAMANNASGFQNTQLSNNARQFNSQVRTGADTSQAMNDAAHRAFLLQGIGNTVQGGVEAGKAMDNNKMNGIYGNILKDYATNWTMSEDGKTMYKKANGGGLKFKKKKK